ncbi:MAG: cation:proton antiporter, partial [Candidatus Bathyarchaeia archaeon]
MWQIVTIAVMLFLMIGLKRLGISSFSGELRPESTVVAGFILVCSFTMGELFRRMRLPALLGYIIFGILFGPNLASIVFGSATSALFGSEVIRDLSLISVLTIGVIGTMGGGELKFSDIRTNLKTILAIVGLIFSVTLISVTALILSVSYLAPDKIGFLNGVSLNERLAAAILFAALAVGMSPSATIAVIQDLKAKGTLTSLVLGIVVVLDLVLVATFLLCLSIARLLASGSFELSIVLEVLPKIGAEFGWAVLLGVVTGLVFILYLHYIHKEMLLFTLLIIFGASYVCSLLHAETLLAFLIAGFCVQNFSKHGHKMIHAIEKISLPAFVLYFSIQAISLDLGSVPKYLVLTGLILVTRLTVFTLSIQLATKWVGTSENIRRNLWMCFYSQGGVDLVLAAMIPPVIPSWGEQLQIVIIATVVVYIILGPPFLKLALDRAGETDEARQRARDEAVALDRAFTVEHSIVPANRLFPVPDFPDATLNQKLKELRSRFVSFHERYIVQPSDAYNSQLNSLVQKIEAASNEVFVQLQKLSSESGQHQRNIEQLKAEWRRSIQPEIAQIERISPLPVTTANAQKILSGVRGAVDFGLILDVEREEELFTHNPDDQLLQQLLKTMRRIRRRLLGPGYRSI